MKYLLLMFVGVMLCGCGSGRPSKSTSQTGERAKTAPARFLVAQTALGHMMRKHANHGVEKEYYSEYLISSEEFLPELVKSFDGFVPRVAALTDATGSVTDNDAKSKLWKVSIVSLTNEQAVAKVSWHAGPLAGGIHRLNLELKDNKWIVVSEKTEVLS